MENKYLSQAGYPNAVSTPSYNSVKITSPFAYKDLEKSLEGIAAAPNPKQKSCPIEDMFSDKAKTLKASVNALLEEIKLREDLNDSHFGKIDGEVCDLRVELMNLESGGCYYPKFLSEARVKIKDNVFELERERRKEGLECWRDLMFLKKYLMGSLKDYWELVRRREVLGE